MPKPLHEQLDAIVQRASRDLPGVVALLTDAHATRAVAVSGVRDLHNAAAMTADTVVWIASMTKPITVIAALQLLEQGRLELDAPASRWFPDLAQVRVLDGFDADGQPQLRPPKAPVTLRQLITHTSGYAYEFFNADCLRFQQATGTPGAASCQLAAFDNPLVFDPGTRWHYGMGIDAVGKVVEGASGQRLGDYLRKHILLPLGMQDTAFHLNASMHARRASIHMRAQDGLKPIPMVVEQNPEFDMGGGGLYSTAADYAQVLRMLLNRGVHQGQRVLHERSVALLFDAAIGDLRVTPLPTAQAHLSNPVDLYPDTPKTWSFGGMVTQAPLATGRAAGSLAWAGLANTYFWVDPIHHVAGVFLSQVLPFADPAALRHFQAFETQAYRALGLTS